MDTMRICSGCRQPLPENAPEGLCPACLARAALGSESDVPAPAVEGNQPAKTATRATVNVDSLAATDEVAQRVGAYMIEAVIAQGGMGIVYRARDTRLNRVVALKMIASGRLATPAEVERFKVEAEAAARLEHPNIVPIYEIGAEEGRHFFTMKLVSHGSLAQAVGGRPLPPGRAAGLVAKLARAVHYAHQRGVLHRDLKPNNVLLDANGEPQLTDFGLAKIAESEAQLTRSLAVMGSASYMAPEQALGQSKQLTTAADIYSLGAVLYETITGRPPFQAGTLMETLRCVIENEPAPPRVWNSAVSPDLQTICLKCLEKEPSRRYASAADLADELERWLRHEPILARPATGPERVLKWVRRKPVVAALLGAVLAVAVLGFSAVSWQLQQTQAALQQARRNALAEATAHASVLHARHLLRHDTAEPARPIVSARFSPDGRLILTASQNGTACLWDAATGKLVRELTGHRGVLADARFSADGRRVLTWSFDSQTRDYRINPAGVREGTSRSFQYGDQSARLWDVETGAVLTIITNAAAQMSCAALSPDGRLIATAGFDNVANVWDAANGQCLHSLTGHLAAIRSLEFSPDGRRLLTTSMGMRHSLHFVPGGFTGSSSAASEDIARFWDVATGAQVGRIRNQARPLIQNLLLRQGDDGSTEADSYCSARYSSDGRWIVTAPDRLRNLGIWNAESGAPRVRLRGHRYVINDAVFSPDGTRVLTGSADATARLWDARTGEEVAALTAHEAPVLGVEFSPDGKLMATASGDGTVRVWDSATGKGLAVLRGHAGKVYSAHFSPDSARIVSAGEDGTARVWDAATPEQLSVVLTGHRGEIRSLSFSRDGTRVLTTGADPAARVWDSATGRPVRELRGLAGLSPDRLRDDILGGTPRAAFSPDGRFVATVADDQDAVILPRFSNPSGAWPPADGKSVPFTPGRIFDARNGRELLGLSGDGCGMSLVAWSPDGRRLLTASSGDQRKAQLWPTGGPASSAGGRKRGPLDAHLWDASNGVLLATLPGHSQGLLDATFSPDGRRILTSSTGEPARLWDGNTGHLVLALEDSQSAGFFGFSPDSQRLLGFHSTTPSLWDAGTGRLVRRFGESNGGTACAVLSPDGGKVLLGGQGVCALYDALDGRQLLRFTPKHGAIRQLRFHPDGRLVAVLDDGPGVSIWRLAEPPVSAQRAATLEGHKDTILDAAFSPDGKWLGTASKDFTARIWPVSALAAGPASAEDE